MQISLFIFTLTSLVHGLNNDRKKISKGNILFVRVESDGSIRKLDFQDDIDVDEKVPPLGKIPSKKIIGGRKSTKGGVPYQIILRRYGTGRCGGSIYNNKTIISAAHCFKENINGNKIMLSQEKIDKIVVIAGEYDFKKSEPEEQYLNIESVIPHPNYDPNFSYDDIAVVKLKTPIKFNEYVQPLPIGYPPIVPESVGVGVISGWGYTKIKENSDDFDSFYFPNVLRETTIKVFSPEECKNIYNNDRAPKSFIRLIERGAICAGKLDGSGDTCQGDSGGPLACIDPVTNDRFLCGIVSTGIGCGLPNFPGLYTRVAAYQKWIIDTSGYADPRINKKPYENTNVLHYPEI